MKLSSIAAGKLSANQIRPTFIETNVFILFTTARRRTMF